MILADFFCYQQGPFLYPLISFRIRIMTRIRIMINDTDPKNYCFYVDLSCGDQLLLREVTQL